MNFFEWLMEIIGWIKIAISPTLLGLIIGAIVYATNQNILGVILASIIASVGLLIGIIWATRVFRSKDGTMHFVSKIHSTPDLDDHPEE